MFKVSVKEQQRDTRERERDWSQERESDSEQLVKGTTKGDKVMKEKITQDELSMIS